VKDLLPPLPTAESPKDNDEEEETENGEQSWLATIFPLNRYFLYRCDFTVLAEKGKSPIFTIFAEKCNFSIFLKNYDLWFINNNNNKMGWP